ncbi:MAG: nuclear transport factor 2 family protein [Rhodospirillaceae bacterium]|jgi:ketosteroid isomerase-like protein
MTHQTETPELALNAWIKAWTNRDTETILSLWDEQDAQSSYLPAERHAPLIGSVAVMEYVETTCEHFSTVLHRAEGILTRSLSPAIGLSFYELNWMLADDRGPMGGTCRVTAIWRNRENQWRLFHYAEAPLAPLLELQAYYESVAADGLDAIPQRGIC